jgi:DNA-binding CsgD family transcriptional regulator/tetratricopeptide (TPR) repeat protein
MTEDRAPGDPSHGTGRSDLMADLTPLVTGALTGSGHLVLIRGEAGVGKSWLIDRVVQLAKQQPCTVLFGRAEEYESWLPYAVIRHALSGVDAGVSRTRTLGLLGPGPVDTRTDERSAGLPAVFASVTDLLGGLAAAGPLVMVIEDVHVADADSLTLLRVLARWAPTAGCLFILSVRTDASPGGRETEAVVDRLTEAGSATVLDVPRLAIGEVASMVQQMQGAPPDRALLQVVWEQSRGNPFFVNETLLALSHSGRLVQRDGQCRLVGSGLPPIGRRTAILHRVFQGRVTARSVARAVAVLGRVPPARLALLEVLTGLPASDMDAAFDELVADAILHQGSDGTFEFAHPLVRAALYDDIGPAERRRLHRAAADWLVAAGDAAAVAEATSHLAESADPGDRPAAELLRAAADSTALVAPLTAAAWYGRALVIEANDLAFRAHVLPRQARSYWLGGRPRLAAECGERALPLLTGPARARMARLVVNALYAQGEPKRAIDVAERMLESEPGDAGLLAQRAHIGLQAGVEHAAWFAAASRATAGADLDVVVASHLLMYADMAARSEPRTELLRRCQSAEPELLPGPRLSLLEVLSMVHADAGDLRAAQDAMTRANHIADGISAGNLGGQFAAAVVRYHWLAGEWDAALDAASAETELMAADFAGNLAIVRALRALILLDRGQYEPATVTLAQVTETMPSLRHLIAMVTARRERLLGAPDRALRIIGPAQEEAEKMGWRQWRHLAAAEMAAAAYEVGDDKAARRAAAVVPETDQRPLAQVIRLRLLGRSHEDGNRLRRAQALANAHGLIFENAMAAMDLAAIGESTALPQALQDLQGLGAAPWVFQVRRAMRGAGLTVPRSTTTGSRALTATEVKMAELVQRGLTNREIASALHYSPKTVEVYLSRVYAKTGVSTRLELARAMDLGVLTGSTPS